MSVDLDFSVTFANWGWPTTANQPAVLSSSQAESWTGPSFGPVAGIAWVTRGGLGRGAAMLGVGLGLTDFGSPSADGALATLYLIGGWVYPPSGDPSDVLTVLANPSSGNPLNQAPQCLRVQMTGINGVILYNDTPMWTFTLGRPALAEVLAASAGGISGAGVTVSHTAESSPGPAYGAHFAGTLYGATAAIVRAGVSYNAGSSADQSWSADVALNLANAWSTPAFGVGQRLALAASDLPSFSPPAVVTFAPAARGGRTLRASDGREFVLRGSDAYAAAYASPAPTDAGTAFTELLVFPDGTWYVDVPSIPISVSGLRGSGAASARVYRRGSPTEPWQAVGGDLGGGAQVLALRPQPPLLAAVTDSGLTVSTDGGTTWRPPADDGLPTWLFQSPGELLDLTLAEPDAVPGAVWADWTNNRLMVAGQAVGSGPTVADAANLPAWLDRRADGLWILATGAGDWLSAGQEPSYGSWIAGGSAGPQVGAVSGWAALHDGRRVVVGAAAQSDGSAQVLVAQRADPTAAWQDPITVAAAPAPVAPYIVERPDGLEIGWLSGGSFTRWQAVDPAGPWSALP
jgi:hypothetical protein